MISDEFQIDFTNQYYHSPNAEWVFLDLKDKEGNKYLFCKRVEDSSWQFMKSEIDNYFKEDERYIINEYPNGLLNYLEIKYV